MTAMMGYARSTIEVAPPPLRGGGVLSVANVVNATRGDHALLGAEYLNDNCVEGKVWTDFCSGAPIASQCHDPGAPAVAKNMDGDIDLVVGDPFAVYAGVSCGLQTIDSARARARQRLAATESAQIDGYIWRMLVTPGASASVPGVTGAISVAEAVGAIEEFQATFYGGMTTLLVPRRYINCLANNGLLTRELDGSLRTYGGSLIAPVTRPLNDNTVDATGRVYGTGRITLVLGPVEDQSVGPMFRSDGTCEPSRALAERVVVPLIECGALAVDVTCCCGETVVP